MGFLKRISQIITPLIGLKSRSSKSSSSKRNKQRDTNHSVVREGGRADRIGHILAHLLSESKSDSRNAHDELLELKDIASEYGAYMTATEIRDCVLRMPDADSEGKAYRKGRGYELAADLFRQDLVKKVKPVHKGILAVSAEEFAAYCKELLECFFLAEKHRRGIQICLVICEDLIIRSCSPSEAARQYSSLARDSVRAILELVLDEKLQADREYNRAKREHRKFDTPMPEDNPSPAAVDEALVAYLDELRGKVHEIDAALSRAEARPDVDLGKLQGNEEEDVLARLLAYTESIRALAKSTRYLPLHALAYEQAAQIKDSMVRGSGAEYYKGAALVSEKEAEKESEFNFTVLSRKHFEHAAQLWRLAGDEPQAVKAKARASELPHQ